MFNLITAVIAFVFTWCLFYGRIAQPFLILICLSLTVFFVYFGRHQHSQALSIDVLAQNSRLKNINPALKFWTLIILLILSVASRNVYTGVFLIMAMLVLAVFAGGLKLYYYVHVLALPLSFLLIGGLALLFEISAEPRGIINLNVFGLWLCITSNAQIQTTLIVSRAFGAVSCLFLLSLTTPMPDIIGVLRRARCPDIFIDLMYLIYRYIFILLSLHHQMHDAAKSRLGFKDYRKSLRSTGSIYSKLLVRSFQIGSKNFDAMESRCYDSGIRFLEQPKKVSAMHLSFSILLVLVSLLLNLLHP